MSIYAHVYKDSERAIEAVQRWKFSKYRATLNETDRRTYHHVMNTYRVSPAWRGCDKMNGGGGS